VPFWNIAERIVLEGKQVETWISPRKKKYSWQYRRYWMEKHSHTVFKSANTQFSRPWNTKSSRS